MQQEHITPSIFDKIQRQNPITYATTGERFANFIVDSIIIRIVSLVVNVGLMLIGESVFSFGEENSPGYTFFFLLIYLSTYVLCYTLLESISNGKTVGKLITKTRVVREDGLPLTWKDTLIRSLCRLVPFEPFSALSGYPWHDKWSKTVVIKDDRIKL